jgi:hypothetical protein
MTQQKWPGPKWPKPGGEQGPKPKPFLKPAIEALRRRTDPNVLQRIRELSSDGYTGPAIERMLTADAEYADRTPSLRTIQDVMREQPVTSEWWSVAEATPEEAALVLPVLADRITHLAEMEGVSIRKLGTVRLAKDLAGWIAKVRAIEPSIPPRDAYRLAWRYWLNPTPDLDQDLALRLGGSEG